MLLGGGGLADAIAARNARKKEDKGGHGHEDKGGHGSSGQGGIDTNGEVVYLFRKSADKLTRDQVPLLYQAEVLGYLASSRARHLSA